MAAIKVHVFIGDDDGSESCDFRGEGFIGSANGDWHRTVLELDPATEETVSLVLETGPSVNALLATLAPSELFRPILESLDAKGGTKMGLRLGVWDE